ISAAMNKNFTGKMVLSVGIVSMVVFMFIYFSRDDFFGPSIKKSTTGICHEKGTLFYKNTKNFTSYNSLDECLKNSGRLPKK
ncbi:MAG: hypothetical protein WBO46_24880, partial [Caldilineaceae bacterium]